jgi:energy-coupling factor transport system substrate-specific component
MLRQVVWLLDPGGAVTHGSFNPRWQGTAILVAVSAAGLFALLLPFVLAAIRGSVPPTGGRQIDAALLLAAIVAAALAVAIGEVARGPAETSLSRSVALLGVLVAIDASLRLVPSFYGASPIFALIVLVGYVFGSRFGFVMGSLTLLLSAAITAGVGPWLPFQMLCAGWVGLAAGWLPRLEARWVQIGAVALFGAFAGFAYGALMNLYSWPFAAPGMSTDVGLYWNPTLTLGESLARYGAFYLTTSLAHDASRAAATALLLLVAGLPVLRLLERFRLRTTWTSSGESDNS